MVEAAISITVENREKAFILHRTPGRRGRTDGRHWIISPSHISLVVVLPARVRRRVFNMLYGRDQGVSFRKSLGRNLKRLSLTALSSKVLL